MRKRIGAALFVVLIATGFYVAAAQQPAKAPAPAARVKIDPTPSYTYKGRWYGLLTCSKLQRQGAKVTPDDVKKCIAGGGRYILAGSGRMDLEPAEKAAPFAGQQVWVTGTTTSTKYGGIGDDESLEGLYAGGDRPATRFSVIAILSIKPTVRDDAMMKYNSVPAELGARVADSAQ